MERINIRKYISSRTNKYNEDTELLQAIEDAVKELEAARSLFDNVQDTNLIEVAIYSEAVARKRYEYLLILAKKRGLRVSNEYVLDQCMKLTQ